ncbi:MAG: hypothetical protein N2C13_00835 [Chloroflexota bacterium]
MKTWFTSKKGAVTLSLIALLSFLGRAFMDWRYEYSLQDPSGDWDTFGSLTYLILIGIWIWGLLAAAKGNRKGWINNLVFVLLLNVAMALATYFIFCPPWTGCVGWPNAWPWNWSNLISGLLAAGAIFIQLRQTKTAN